MDSPDNFPAYPAEADTRHASPELVDLFTSFFAAKNRHDVDATMDHFSPDVVTYTETTLGWPLDGYDIIKGTFDQYMPQWPDTALSYPTRVLGDTGSALVAFTDTPELFGGELRILGAVDFQDGKIIRWADYWDSTRFDDELYVQVRTPDDAFPTDFQEGRIEVSAAPAMVSAAERLLAALADGDAGAAAQLMSYDVVYEDMAMRIQVLGRAEVEDYLGRVLDAAPYGKGATLRHVVGAATAGGFEWIAAAESTLAGGITAVQLDANGLVSRLTTVYDGRLLEKEARNTLRT